MVGMEIITHNKIMWRRMLLQRWHSPSSPLLHIRRAFRNGVVPAVAAASADVLSLQSRTVSCRLYGLQTIAAATSLPTMMLRTSIITSIGSSSMKISSSDSSSSNIMHQQQQVRFKHSSTQIKRLFRQHPARLRVEGRLGIHRTKQPTIYDDTDNTVVNMNENIKSLYHPLQPLQFAPIWTPKFLPNGWSAPPPPLPLQSNDLNDSNDATSSESLQRRPDYPFSVQRTKNKPRDATGFLPVYTKHRKDGTKIVTRIKGVSGNRDLFVQELRTVLQRPAPVNGLAAYDTIRIRTGGLIEVKGSVAHDVRTWLAGLGF